MKKKPASATGPRVTKPQPIEITDGARVERYRGERTDDGRTRDPGDIEEETLDRDAPFNKTYGKVDEDQSSPL